MNLDHVRTVQARIQEIRRRFVDPAEARSSQPSSFSRALEHAQARTPVACPSELEPVIAAAANRYGVDAALIKAVINVESGFRSTAVSRVGAHGLMQLMPGTARALGVDSSDPAQNIDGGTRYLKEQLDRFGSLEKALAAYNAGPGSVVRYGDIPPYEETQNYVREVMESISAYGE